MLLDVLGDEPQSIIRDYVDDTGALINLDGAAAHRNFYTALFDSYDVLTTDILHRLSQDSYLFAETRITARQKQGAKEGGIVSFNTAEWFAQGKRDSCPHGAWNHLSVFHLPCLVLVSSLPRM